MVCKGKCVQYKAKRSTLPGNLRYKAGQRRCSVCEIFIKWEGRWCPCCGFTLRTKPRNSRDRHKLQEMTIIKRY